MITSHHLINITLIINNIISHGLLQVYYYLHNIAIIAISLVPSISAVDYIVGDEAGWTTNFDYQAWAQDKMFLLHSTIRRENIMFSKQMLNTIGSVPLTSGNDVITLATPGRKWYLCGVSQHCSLGGQKLSLYVIDQFAWSPMYPPTPAPLPFPGDI
ncbi:hypothetical protein F8388_019424 [Cannabis sativa]|uniref:Phytocyanin domain-containing protein n=1 Tax=Cannabis sativa TaxID=3483 RepID=A0A7J6FFX0_CANSA|nr:hypothetical protein F8388_019424 [Cannabis sativa]